ncbi:MAG TPA: MATE family efflux transporter, partial [Comamonadaceae bacterium]|nr:MATE family efflux transporter [Comamonadaceae bacterium]
PADVLEDALRYARVMMLMMPVLLVFILFTQLLRGVSDTISPLLALLISTTTGLILTPAFIQGWLGLPRLGILSAAVASLLSTAAAMVFLAVRLRRMGHVMAPDRKLLAAFRIDRAILSSVFRIGLPTGVQMVVMSLSQLVILALVNQHGSQATAAYGAVTQVVNYVQFPALSIAITASILAAQAIGEGATERLGAILSTGLWLNVAITGSFVLLGYALSQTLLGLFLTDPAVRAQGGHLLHIMLWSLLVFGFQAMVSGIMRASGDVLVPTGITIFCILVVQMGVAWALNRRIGLEGIWIGFPVAYLAMLA